MRLAGLLLLLIPAVRVRFLHLRRGGSWKGLSHAEDEWTWFWGFVATLGACLLAASFFSEEEWILGAMTTLLGVLVGASSIARLRGWRPTAKD